MPPVPSFTKEVMFSISESSSGSHQSQPSNTWLPHLTRGLQSSPVAHLTWQTSRCCSLCLCALLPCCCSVHPSILACHWLKALLTNLSAMAPFPHCPFLCSQPIGNTQQGSGLMLNSRLTLGRTLELGKPHLVRVWWWQWLVTK